MTRVRFAWPLIGATIAVCALLGACSKNEPQAPPETQPTLPAVTLEGIEKAISAYEQIGEALSQDHANIQAEALALAGAAKTASMTAPQELKEPLDNLSDASQRMATLAVGDLAETRSAFGNVSQAMVSVLSAAPSLQQGLHVYQCPMADGYQKWVQSGEPAQNPYMGTKMPKCGTVTDF
ncbi:MAG: hypothetical protein PVH21_08005 [Myxococcales bacterium]